MFLYIHLLFLNFSHFHYSTAAQNGLCIACTSVQTKIFFKVTVFNKNGDAVLVSRSSKQSLDKSYNSAVVFFTKFPVYDFNNSCQFNADFRSEDSSVADAFNHLCKVENFEQLQNSTNTIEAGRYLVAVSFEESSGVVQKALERFGNIPYKLIAVQANASSPEAISIDATDKGILEIKTNMGSMKAEYETSKAQVFMYICIYQSILSVIHYLLSIHLSSRSLFYFSCVRPSLCTIIN